MGRYAEIDSLRLVPVTKVADIGGKRLISLAPDAWVRWVTQQSDLVALEIVGGDFQWISRDNDSLIKVAGPTLGEFLVLTELQLRYPQTMPLRVRAYTGLAEEKYNLPVYPVLVNILPPSAGTVIPKRFERNFAGIQAIQDYRVINLWEVPVESVFEQSLVTLMPFVPILQGGGEPQVIQQAVQVLQQDPELNELESLLAFFASFVLDTELVAQIMRWDMAVLRESPWYQEIDQQGEQRGLLRGREEGRQEGRQEGAAQEASSLVFRQLSRLFTLSPSLRQQVQTLSLSQLESLSEALLDFQTVADLEAWLANEGTP
jgi:predicted transposase YdaD